MKKKIAISLTVLLLALVVGEIGPRLMIDSGLQKFPKKQIAFVKQALTEARLFFSGSAEPLFWTAIRVEEVTEREVEGQTCYEATVRAYTLFGLPWSSVLVSSCNEGRLIRQYWGLAPFIIGWPSYKR